jgi:hypothetical protein
VDWPTIYGKLAYADSHEADYLLMCISSRFTPAAITQVESWNSTRRTTKIRLWPLQELEVQLKQHPDLMLKYGLTSVPNTPGYSIVSLSLAMSKAVGSYYSELIFKDVAPSNMLQAAQAFADLISRRMEDIEIAGKIRPVLSKITAGMLDGLEIKNTFEGIDEVGLRAFVAYLIALTRVPVDISSKHRGTCEIEIQGEVSTLLPRYRDAFSAISLWSEFEFSFVKNIIFIRQR